LEKEKHILISVVHVVVDGVDTTARAGVAAGGAARSSRRLGRSVVDAVAGGGAAALEGVVEVHPVTNLVGGGAAQVVGGGSTAGDGLAEDGATVENEVGGAASVARGGEVAVAEEAAAQVAEEVDVQVGVGSLAESLLHGLFGAVGSPVGVDGVVGADQLEGDAMLAVRVVHDGELVVNHGLLCMSVS